MEKPKRQLGTLTLLCNREYFNSFRSLGNAFPPSEELVLQLNRFVCLLYRDKNSENVNKCRFSLFKSGKYLDDQLPPTCDSFLQHIRRANYQAAIWLNCLQPHITIPPSSENGWQIIEGQLQVVWMTIPPALDSLLKMSIAVARLVVTHNGAHAINRP